MITLGSKCRPRNNSSTLFSSLTVGPQLSKGHCNRRDRAICTRAANLRVSSAFNQSGDWVFASPASGGRKPYWPDMALFRHVRPAATKLGITKRIGWHTFRHTYATLLKSSGADVKVVQDSLRHANARITMEMYTQALSQDKRTAQTKVVQMILPRPTPLEKAG